MVIEVYLSLGELLVAKAGLTETEVYPVAVKIEADSLESGMFEFSDCAEPKVIKVEAEECEILKIGCLGPLARLRLSN